MYRTKSHQFYKPNPQHARVRQFWRIYRKVKMVIGIIYDASAVLVVLLSFDRIYKFRSWRVLKPWQVATLIEKVPKLFRTLRHNLSYGL